jgi:uncharacterized protein YqeY
MPLIQHIQDDLKAAMKAGEKQAVSTLRMLQAALKNKKIELLRELEDDDVLTVMKHEVKQITEAAAEAVKAGREELVLKAKEELQILKKYLPAELQDAEVEALVKEVMQDLAATVKDTGRVIGSVMQKAKGRVDGQRVRQMVEKLLKN